MDYQASASQSQDKGHSEDVWNEGNMKKRKGGQGPPRSMVRLEKAGDWWLLGTDFAHPIVEERPASSTLARLAPLQTTVAPSCAFLCGQPGCHRGPAHPLSSEQGTSCDGSVPELLVYKRGEQDPVFSKTLPNGSSASLLSCGLYPIWIRVRLSRALTSSRAPTFHSPSS